MSSSYLAKGFAPIRFETEVDQLEVDGAWPRSLTGTLYRIGPNPQFEPIPPYNPLLGDGMVHAFFIDGGQIAYRNRWVRTEQWRLEHRAGRALFATSADPRRHDPTVAKRRTDGVANTNLCWHAGRLLALEEGHPPIELDASTLATRGRWSFHGRLPGNMTAHPKLDPHTGELIFFANYPRRRFDGEIAWYVADRHGQLTGEHILTAPFPSLVHDFAVTRDFVVFIVCPATLSVERAVAGGPAIAWEPEKGTRIAVVARREPEAAHWLDAPARFVWHVLNAWNDAASITIDLCEQAAPAFPDLHGRMAEPERWQQHLARWQINLSADTVRARRLSNLPCEYPRMNERDAMKPTAHGYFACHGGPGTGDPFHRGVARYGFADGQLASYHFGSSCAVSEPVFASGNPATGSGYLLCLAYDERSDRSYLALLDAATVESGPVATAWLPHRVPMGFHGLWLPGRR